MRNSRKSRFSVAPGNVKSALINSSSYDQGGEGLTTHQDDEYRWAGVKDPKIMVTTSRDPSSRLKQFAKEIKLLLPNAQRLNRGGYEIQELVKACVANEVTDLVLLHETRGDPDQIGKKSSSDKDFTPHFSFNVTRAAAITIFTLYMMVFFLFFSDLPFALWSDGFFLHHQHSHAA